MKLKRLFSVILAITIVLQLCPAVSFAAGNGDEVTRTLEIRTDMVHDNPGATPYITEYDDVEFLARRGLTGKVFFLSESAHLAIDWQDYDKNIFPEGSDGYNWVQQKKQEYTQKYKEAKEAGLKVYFMMDFVSLPNSMKTLYGDQILTNNKIDINKAKTKEVLTEMVREIFTEFPDLDGIYPRYGESYVGYYSGYHFGNNPIAVSGTKANDHVTLLNFFRDEVCDKYGKEVVYRTWSTETGDGSFTTSPSLYLEITNQVEPHENLYIAIKHTAGDFWRNYTFNQTIGIGNHQQIIEIQCAREYEGKGAHPNYIAGGVINGFPEYEWQMSDDEAQCLRDVVNCKDSKVVGIWTWSRGGGWGGPYVNGEEGQPDGSELWCDLNAYVLHKWAQDTSQSDEDLVKQYAKEELGMSNSDAETFLQIALKSADAVLYGKATNSAPMLEVNWMRDSSINSSLFNNCVNTMYANREVDGSYTKLNERRYSVSLWTEMVELAATLDDSLGCKDFIEVTCEYGLDLYSITERLFTAAILSQEMKLTGARNVSALQAVASEYDALWADWEALFNNNDFCPTLYGRSGFDNIMANYRYSISSPSVISLAVGDTSSVGVSVSPYSISDIRYSSTNEAVATVSDDGTVTAVGNGITRIEMVTADGMLSASTMVCVDPNGGIVKESIYTDDFEDYTVNEKLDWPMNVTTDKQYLTVTDDSNNKVLTVVSSAIGGGTSGYHTQTFPAATGNVITEFDMAVKNTNSGYFFLCDSNGKIITQVDFRGDGIYVDIGGSVKKISSLPYNAGEWYHIKIESDTDNKLFTISVNDTDPVSYNFREAAVNVGMIKVGLNRNSANTVYYDNIDIYTLKAKNVDITAEQVASTITSVVVNNTDTTLSLPTVPEGYSIEIYSSSDKSLIALDGRLKLSTSENIVDLVFKITRLSDSTSATTSAIRVNLPIISLENIAPEGTGVCDDPNSAWYNTSSGLKERPATLLNDGIIGSGQPWSYYNTSANGNNFPNVDENGVDYAWVGIEFDGLYMFNQVKIYWSTNEYGHSDRRLEYSVDSETWIDITDSIEEDNVIDSSMRSTIETYTLETEVKAKFVRVYMENCTSQYPPNIWEMEIYGQKDFVMLGAQTKVQDESTGEYKLRFVTAINTDYFTVKGQQISATDIAEIGTLLVRADSGISDITLNNNDNGIKRLPATYLCNVYADNDGIYTFTAALTNIGSDKLDTEYTARAYMILDDGTVYYTDPITRSVSGDPNLK